MFFSESAITSTILDDTNKCRKRYMVLLLCGELVNFLVERPVA